MRSIYSALAFLFITTACCTTALAQNSPQDYVNAHNAARSAVGVGPVSWDNTVAAYARNYANQRIGDCRLEHSGGPYGENLFWGSGREYTAADAVDSWVSEKQDYDYNRSTCAAGKVCVHYTQVVWRSSTAIGCARVKCNSGAIFIICNYNPPGCWSYEEDKLNTSFSHMCASTRDVTPSWIGSGLRIQVKVLVGVWI